MRVFIDVNVFGDEWFQTILSELVETDCVRFSYSEVDKLTHELEKVSQALKFYKLMGEMNRRDSAESTQVQSQIEYLESHVSWRNEASCDDPHIFAIVREIATQYIFTNDKRIAKCRGCMNRVIDKRYCSFKLVTNLANYKSSRHKILS